MEAEKIIKLQKGMPSDDMLGRDLVEQCLGELSAQTPGTFDFLNYGEDGGDAQHLELIAEWLNKTSPEFQGSGRGKYRPFEAKDFFSSAGNSHALSVLCTMFVHGQDSTVLVDDPSYPWAIKTIKDHRANLQGVPQRPGKDTDVEEVDRLCTLWAERKKPVALMYVVPSFHNPTGVTMSSATRTALVALARKHNFFLVADDVYQLLSFPSAPPPPPHIICFDENDQISDPEGLACRVVSLGSFSKIFSPALRCGWFHTRNAEVKKQLMMFGEHISGGGFSAFAARIPQRMLASNRLDVLQGRIRKRLEEKCTFLCDAVQRFLGPLGCTFERPTGGYFVWVNLGQTKFPARTLLEQCKAAHPVAVEFFAGETFSPSGGQEQFMRFSFALFEEADLEAGVKIVADKLKELLKKRGADY